MDDHREPIRKENKRFTSTFSRPHLSLDENQRNPFSGSLSRPLWKIANSIKSQYPDSFDYSVYDRLSAKFGEKQPRGGVLFRTSLKAVNHHASCSKCHYAFELDTYGRGCLFNCVYCYAKEQLSKRLFWNEPHPFPVDISSIRKIFATVFETDKRSKWRSILEGRIPLRLGSMSDCFLPMDRKYKVTLETLKLLQFYQYPTIIFTRSELVADDEYLKFMDPNRVFVQMSICGGNEQLTRQLEPGAPTVERRLATLKKLNQNGFWTAVRINPLFPKYPDGYYTDRTAVEERFGGKENIPTFPLFDLPFLRDIRDVGTTSVVVGVVRLSVVAVKRIAEATGIQYRHFFKPEIWAPEGYKMGHKHFSDPEIAFYYKRIQSECAALGMRFNSCYIGNGIKDYFQYQGLWANKKDCCDARGVLSSFKSSSQDIPWKKRVAFARSKLGAHEAHLNEEKASQVFGALTEKTIPEPNGASILSFPPSPSIDGVSMFPDSKL